MIVRGSEKGIFEFYIVIKIVLNLIYKKEAINTFKKLFRALISLIHFSLPRTKEKSLYNITFTRLINMWGGPIGTLSR